MEKTAEVRREIETTRERMAATAGEIESRIHDKVDAVKSKVDVVGLVRAHPWPALAIAAIAGATFAATDSDRKTAVAATRAVKKAPRVTVKAVKGTASGTAHLAGAAVKRLRGGGDDHDSHHREDGFFGRLKTRLAAQARELGEHMGRAADDIVRSTGARTTGSGTPARIGAADDLDPDSSIEFQRTSTY